MISLIPWGRVAGYHPSFAKSISCFVESLGSLIIHVVSKTAIGLFSGKEELLCLLDLAREAKKYDWHAIKTYREYIFCIVIS
ncbi:MAG: hypothetical protein R3Y58_03555 [Eubacteriales bacterium]